jgi:hypothetical protein
MNAERHGVQAEDRRPARRGTDDPLRQPGWGQRRTSTLTGEDVAESQRSDGGHPALERVAPGLQPSPRLRHPGPSPRALRAMRETATVT